MRIIKAGEYLAAKPATLRPSTVPYDPEIAPYARWRYAELSCGHLTSPETDELYHAFKPHRGLHWCETCNKWRELKPRPKIESSPIDPLF